jgi:3-oxoacyl-[acyl-carrier-protein] synthase II
VAITGVGLVSTAGVGLTAHRAALTGPPPAPGTLAATEALAGWAGFGAQVDAAQYLGKAGLRSMDRTTRHALVATKLACEEATLPHQPECAELGVVLASTYGAVTSLEALLDEIRDDGAQFLNPAVIPYGAGTMQAAQVAIRFGACGPNVTLAGGSAVGFEALRVGAELIRCNDAEVVLAGGTDAFDRRACEYLERIGLLPPPGSVAGQPYHPQSLGLLPGEAAATLVLESEERATARGARILGYLAGSGSAVASDPRSAPALRASVAHAAREALRTSALAPGALAWIAGGGSGLAEQDAAELLGLSDALGGAFDSLPVSAVKATFGECISASGVLQVAAAVLSFQEGRPLPAPLAHEGRGSVGGAGAVLCSALSWEGAAGALVVCPPARGV